MLTKLREMVWLTHLRDRMSSRRIWWSSSIWPMGMSWSLRRPNTARYSWVRGTPVSTQAGEWTDRAALMRRAWGCWWMRGWEAGCDPSISTYSPESQRCAELHLNQCRQQGTECDFLPSTPFLWDPTWSPVSTSGILSTGKTQTCWIRPRGELPKWSGSWRTS